MHNADPVERLAYIASVNLIIHDSSCMCEWYRCIDKEKNNCNNKKSNEDWHSNLGKNDGKPHYTTIFSGAWIPRYI